MIFLKQTAPLVFAMVIMPFTSLRLGPIGLGEIIFLFIFLLLLVQTRMRLPGLKGFLFTKFWMAYIAMTVVGAFYNHLFLGSVSGEISLMLFDLIAFLVVAVIVYLLEYKALTDPGGFRGLAWNVYRLQFLAFAGLHIVSYFQPNILGLPLRYYVYFTPLVENVHQTAMLLCSLPFLGLFFLQTKEGLMIKTLLLISFVWYGVMAFETGTSKAGLGFILGGFVALTMALYSSMNKVFRLSAIVVLISVSTSVFMWRYEEILGILTTAFSDADPASARAILYSKGLEHALNSIFVGYGPGPHIQFVSGIYSDVHQTFLAIFLQGGLIALTMFLVFLALVLRRVVLNPYLIGGLASTMIYMTGGDILRRAPMWIFLLTIFYLARSLRRIKPQDTDYLSPTKR